jgi:uncharacterized protein YecT (DUF1311 family)
MVRVTGLSFAAALMFASTASCQTDQQVAARLSATLHACENAPENGGTFQQAICYRDEAARQDRRLNDTWKRVMDRLPPGRREALRRDERRWIKERDADCRDEADAYIGSTAAYMGSHCVAEETIRRTMWLESFR